MKLFKIFISSLIVFLSVSLLGCQKQKSEQGETGTSPVKKITQKVTGKKEEPEQAGPHAGWVTFDQPKHKFSLMYPQGWSFVSEIDKDDLFTGTLEREDPDQEDFVDQLTGVPFTVVYTINMRVEENPENLSAKDHELSRYIPQGRDEVAKGFQDVTLAGVKGIKMKDERVTPVNTSGPVTQYKLAPGNGKAYSFWYTASAHEETHEKYLKEFEEILSTLEFSD